MVGHRVARPYDLMKELAESPATAPSSGGPTQFSSLHGTHTLALGS